MTQTTTIAEVVALADFGQPGAVKRGRNPRWPYVPVVAYTVPGLASGSTVVRTTQILGVAYATREEAIAKAEQYIEANRQSLAEKLAQPRYRALRESYGLPREIS